MATEATRRWQQMLDSGRYYPGLPGDADIAAYGPGGTRSKEMSGQSLGSEEDLYDLLLAEAGGPKSEDVYWTGQDIYDFFVRPGEVEKMRNTEALYRRGYQQALERSGGSRAKELQRLGLAGTATGARQAGYAGRESGGLAASAGLQAAMEAAAKQYESPTRFQRVRDMASEILAAGERRGGKIGTAAELTTGAHSQIGGSMMGSGNPIMAGVGALVAAGGAAWGAGISQSQADVIERAAEKSRDFSIGGIDAAKFRTPAYASSGLGYSPYGSSESALQRAYGGGSAEEDRSFLYG
jgi:hypothetical protein